MRRRTLIGVLTLAGCASPTPDLFTLAPIAGSPRPGRAGSVELRRIGLAGYLDRPEIIHSSSDYRLRVSDRDRWGEPLGSMISRVLTENLLQRLPGTAIYVDSGAISAKPDLVLEIDVQRFDADATEQVVLLAQIAVRRDDGRGPVAPETLRIPVTPGAPGIAAQVAAMSVALGELADDAAQRIRAGVG